MKQKVVYCCDFCECEFTNPDECEEHEAYHFNLSPVDYYRWKQRLKVAAEAGKSCGCNKNPETDKKFDDAVKRLVDFEEEHNLTQFSKKPSHFYI